jgi:hypothetical protein
MNEDKFILNAARINLSEENISVLKEISSNGINWDNLSQKAARHGVDSFIYYSLKKHNIETIIPEKILEKYKIAYYGNALRNSIFLDEFNKLSKSITNKIITLKGINLIQSLYPNIAIRSMCDIDILVEKEYAIEIYNTLSDKDYQRPQTNSKSTLHAKIETEDLPNHMPALCVNNCSVEIHWNLFNGNRLYEITKSLWTKSSKSSNVFSLSNEMMLIHLCSHYYKHILYRGTILRMLCDINEFIFNYENTINWDEIKEICHDPELKNEMDIALTYAHVLLNTPIPQDFVSMEIMNRSDITIASLVQYNKPINAYQRLFLKIIELKYPFKIVIFIFRTFIPVREWMTDRYNIITKWDLFIAYLKYWQYLVNVHILNKEVKLGNK